MTDTSYPSDVAAALAAARPLHETVPAGLDAAELLVHPDDVDTSLHDVEQYQPYPTRQRGNRVALTADGFLNMVERFTTEDSPCTVYADIDRCELLAILNDDKHLDTGWRDHRVTYTPQATPEWKLWVGGQGLGNQERFAAVIEEGETDIVTPSATTMLEIAETFHASTTAKFKQAGRSRDGRTQLVYEEEIEATAGEGMVEIPTSFTVRVRPFYGAQPVDVECKLRYRVIRGDLTIGYTINRPDEIRRQSFQTDVLDHIGAELEFPVVDGLPAATPTARG